MSTQDRIGGGCTEAVSPKTVTKIVKHDSGKSPVFRGVFQYFPKALQAVADISAMGAKKYSWGGWKDSATFADVHRFEDALGRHLLNEQVEGWYDPESNLLHAAHAAWNALAKLELLLGGVPMKDPSSPNANLQKAAQTYAQSQNVAGSNRPISNTRECVDSQLRTTTFGGLSGSISRY
jgi:hypothetical protein